MPSGDAPRIAVIGAGPAGTTAALGLLRRGARVVLIDPGTPPPFRIESLPQNGIDLLVGLGIWTQIAEPRHRVIVGAVSEKHHQWRSSGPEVLRDDGHFPVLIDKRALHRLLMHLAIQAGADLVIGRARFDGFGRPSLNGAPIAADLIIDARGRRVGSDGLVAIGFIGGAKGRPDALTLAAKPDGWLWQVSASDGTQSGAYFTTPRNLQGLGEHQRRKMIDGISGSGAARVFAPALAGLSFQPRVWQPEVALLRIGDAALARDPIGAHGLTHALRSGAQAGAGALDLIGGDGLSAAAFFEGRHAGSVRSARRSTLGAYQDQTIVSGGFWQDQIAAHSKDCVYELCRDPGMSPSLTDQWIMAVPAPYAADRAVIGALAKPGTEQQLVARLALQLPAPMAQAVFERLLLDGVLLPKMDLARRRSQPPSSDRIRDRTAKS